MLKRHGELCQHEVPGFPELSRLCMPNNRRLKMKMPQPKK